MAGLLSPAPPASARPSRTRPVAFNGIGKANCKINLEQDLADALRDIADKPCLDDEDRERKAVSEVSTALPSAPSTAAPSTSPSRRGSWEQGPESGSNDEDGLHWTPEIPQSQGSRSSSCTPQFSRPSVPGESPDWKRSPNTRRKVHKQFKAQFKAAFEEARAVNPVSPWLEMRSAAPLRNRDLSLPCVEVGYWSVLDFEKTPRKPGQNRPLSISRQEEVRRLSREMLSAKRGSEREKDLADQLSLAYKAC